MTPLPLSLALSSVLGAAVDGDGDRHRLLTALRPGPARAADRLAPVVPLRRPVPPDGPGPDRPRAA